MQFFLLSYPRSGNTWSRYLIEYFSKRPTTSCPTTRYPEDWAVASRDSKGLCESVEIDGVDKSAEFIAIKKHRMFPSEQDSLPMVLVVRNYKECLIRHLGSQKAASKHISGEDNNSVNYFQCLSNFDSWKGEKLLIYYEDLIDGDCGTLKKLCEFMKCHDEKKIKEFTANIDFHKSNGIKSYESITVIGKGASQSGGNEKIFHSKSMSHSEKREWDEMVKDRYPVLFERYLKRYEEDEVKLHLGCGGKSLPGFINCDLYNENADKKCDIRDLSCFDDNSIDLIYASHVLEHVKRHEVSSTVEEWCRVLRPGGKLYVAVPDFEAVASHYMENRDLKPLQGLLNGGQNYEGNEHYVCFDFSFLKEILAEQGFVDVDRYDWRESEFSDFDDFSKAYLPHMDFENGRLMSLNVLATKGE